ncbi:MAG TPA: response regulator [Pyrinomonadaceae bacterium]|jgi:DNA-binding NtrC family response regulator
MQRTVFYFDDEASLLDVFREMFSDQYDVRTAATLSEARRVLAECSAEIIISDQSMPEIDGTEFLREAAAMCPESFRILLTGQVSVGDVLEEVSTGIIHLFETKPWREERMREILDRASTVLDRRIR